MERFEPAVTENAKELIYRLTPALAQGNLSEALQTVMDSWTVPQLIELLSHNSSDIRKIAALALGLVGDREAVGPLARALHDDDAMVTSMAEHALWSIWFRLGNAKATCLLKCGSNHLNHGNYDCAVEKFTQAIESDPEFAEAYNQRAIAHYLSERYDACIADCKATLARMPQHFGAMSGMGHCYAQMQDWAEARHCYSVALAIHPRLEGIQAALFELNEIPPDHFTPPCP